MSHLSALKDFLRLLERRKERIRRGAYLTSIEFGPIFDDKAHVKMTWHEKSGEEKSFTHSWTAEELYGHIGTTKPRLKKGCCRIAGELVREVLMMRGVVR